MNEILKSYLSRGHCSSDVGGNYFSSKFVILSSTYFVTCRSNSKYRQLLTHYIYHNRGNEEGSEKKITEVYM